MVYVTGGLGLAGASGVYGDWTPGTVSNAVAHYTGIAKAPAFAIGNGAAYWTLGGVERCEDYAAPNFTARGCLTITKTNQSILSILKEEIKEWCGESLKGE